MPSVFDHIPETLRHEAERKLQRAVDERTAKLSAGEAKIWRNYGNPEDFEHGVYNEVARALAELQLIWAREYFEAQVSVWAPLFVTHAPRRLSRLRDALLADARRSPQWEPRLWPRLKAYADQSFIAVLDQGKARAGAHRSRNCPASRVPA